MDRDVTGPEYRLSDVIDLIKKELRSGARHGFFELQIAGNVVRGDRRQITVKCGRSWMFVLRPDEIEL